MTNETRRGSYAEHAEEFPEFDSDVPKHLRDGLQMYIEHHYRPGGFLEAVLSNDLKEAMGRADEQSRAGLFAIVRWLYNKAPSSCWGSPQRFAEWITEQEEV